MLTLATGQQSGIAAVVFSKLESCSRVLLPQARQCVPHVVVWWLCVACEARCTVAARIMITTFLGWHLAVSTIPGMHTAVGK